MSLLCNNPIIIRSQIQTVCVSIEHIPVTRSSVSKHHRQTLLAFVNHILFWEVAVLK